MNYLDRFSQSIHISKCIKIRPLGAELFHTDRHDKANVNQFFSLIFYIFTWKAEWRSRAAAIVKYLRRQDYTHLKFLTYPAKHITMESFNVYLLCKKNTNTLLSSKINKPLMLLSDEQPAPLRSVLFKSIMYTFTVRHGSELQVCFLIIPTTILLK